MLRRRGVVAVCHFGAKASDPDSIDAHAWVTVGSMYVIGERSRHRFVPLTAVTRGGGR